MFSNAAKAKFLYLYEGLANGAFLCFDGELVRLGTPPF